MRYKLTNKANLILIGVILIGFFLRSYNLHNWLKIRDDQSRDAFLVNRVISEKMAWPLQGPYMSYSGDGDHLETNAYHIGPIYYYFQIISAKLFGNYADKLAYPDVFFGVMSILLLFYFLRIYLGKNLALVVITLYATSAYFIEYSRFAWNTNLIPCFVLLFLLSLYKFLEKKEKTPWIWVILMGIAFGVGVQLHVLILVIFSITLFFVLLFSYKAWKKWLVVFLIFLALNIPQIITELKTNFSNTKILFNFSSHENQVAVKPTKLELLQNNLDCHIEATAYYLASYGENYNCTYDFLSPTAYGGIKTKHASKMFSDLTLRTIMLASVLFFVFGWFLFFRYAKIANEKKQKYFFYLIALYLIITFLIMFPLSTSKFNDLRYLTQMFFLPYLFLGLLFKFIQEKFPNKFRLPIAMIFMLILFSNIVRISTVVSTLLEDDRTCSSHSTTLGELEPVADYMRANSNNRKTIHFGGDKSLRVVFGPLSYILKKHDLASQEVDLENKKYSLENDQPIFGISCKFGMSKTYSYEKIGNIYVYKIDK